MKETLRSNPSGKDFFTSIILFFMSLESSTVEAPLFAYIPIPTVLKFIWSLVWALNKVFSETGPNSIFATSESNIIFLEDFLIGYCFIVLISL